MYRPPQTLFTLRFSLRIAVIGVCLSLGACSRSDAAALPEWTPADHSHQEAAVTGQVDTKKKRPGMPNLERQGVNDVVLATWKQSCMPCHGVIGRGDGPEGRVVRPPDFTLAKWQESLNDTALALTIKTGKGKMPSFEHLPATTVKGLVTLIRLLGARGKSSDAEATKGTSANGPGAGGIGGSSSATGGSASSSPGAKPPVTAPPSP